MAGLLTEITDDLAAEQAALEGVLDRLGPEDWERPTHAPGWAVRDQVAHLAFFDEAAARVIETGDDVLAGLGRREASDNGSYLDRARERPAEEILAWWREASANLIATARGLDASRRLPWGGRHMSATSFLTARLMECWSHGLDVVDVVAPERPDTDRLRHVVQIGLRTRPFSYTNRKMDVPEIPIRVVLTAPSGSIWAYGDEQAEERITGTATDFCRVVTQRRHLADTGLKVEGGAALEWMSIAQAFAGPPGQGRKPGEFAHEDATETA